MDIDFFFNWVFYGVSNEKKILEGNHHRENFFFFFSFLNIYLAKYANGHDHFNDVIN
jgi:hypothetical protein